jgi:hypothetical protein
MKNIKYIAMGYLLATITFVLLSCADNRPIQQPETKPEQQIATNVPQAPKETKTPLEQKIDALQKQLDVLNTKADTAASSGNKVDQLTAEKDALLIKTQLAEAYATEWKNNAAAYSSQGKEKEKELAQAKLDAWKVKLWWMAGICGFLAIVSAGLAWGMPLLRPIAKKAAIIFAAIAGLMLFVAESISTIAWLLGLVPYIIGIAVVIAMIYIVVGLYHWWLDHHSLSQVIQAIDPIKTQVSNFGEHMEKNLDSSLIKNIDKYRVGLGIKKVKSKILDIPQK